MKNNYTYKADVLRVVDGDTIDVRLYLPFDIQIKQRVRLSSIDAPESRTRNLEEKQYGLAAKQWLYDTLELNSNKCVIKTTLDKKGKFGRVLGDIFVSSTNLNEAMAETGMATRYTGKKKAPWPQRKRALDAARLKYVSKQ